MEQSFLWIKSAIDSCITEFHLDCCNSLIGFFINKYGADPDFKKYYDELIEDYINKETFLSVIL